MTQKTASMTLVALLLLSGASLFAQQPAVLAGTWVGTATLETEAEPNELTLVLEVKDGELTGHMTDQYGTMNQAPISDVGLEEGTLGFSVEVETPGSVVTLTFSMVVTGDSMKGKLDVPDMGISGAWEAARQK